MNLENSVVAKAGFCKPIANPKQVIKSPNDLGAKAKGVIDSPNDIDSVVKGQILAPNVLTANAYSDLPPFPETHGRILYENKLISSSVSASEGVNETLTLTPNTFEGWTVSPISGSDAFITFVLPASEDIDTLCVGAHNLNGLSYKWQAAATLGGAFTDLTPLKLQESNNAIMSTFATVNAREVRLFISGSGSFKIGVISGGESLQLQRPKYGGVSPSPLNAKVDYFNNRSESGEWVGRSIRRQGFTTALDMVRITPEWYRLYFQPFVESAKTTPFFYSWRPADYPDDVVYCWTESDIKPSNSGKREFMNVSFNINCHGSV